MANPRNRGPLPPPEYVAPEACDLIAVYRTPDDAVAARAALLTNGVAAGSIRLEDAGDRRSELLAEMRQEVDDAFVAPQAAFIATKEMTKGMVVTVPVLMLVGALVLLPFAFISIGGLSLVARLVIFLAVGAAGGLVAGAIIGAGIGAQGPDEPMAAEVGTVLRVSGSGDHISTTLVRHRPIRVDLVRAADGAAAGTVYTDDGSRIGDVAHHIVDQTLHHPGGGYGEDRQPRPGEGD